MPSIYPVPELGWFKSATRKAKLPTWRYPIPFSPPLCKSSYSGSFGEYVEVAYAPPTLFRGSSHSAPENHSVKVSDRTARAAIRDTANIGPQCPGLPFLQMASIP